VVLCCGDKQIPFGNDRQKNKGKNKNTDKNKDRWGPWLPHLHAEMPRGDMGHPILSRYEARSFLVVLDGTDLR